MQSSRSSTTGLIEAGSIDPETEREVERLRFTPETESEFQRYFIQRSLPRARWATAIYLALVAVVTAINMRGTMIPFGQSILEPVYLLRLGVACPALVVILAATVIPELHRHYQWIASTAVIVTGISVMLISGFAAAGGPAAIPNGRRARRRLRDVVPRLAVSRRAGGRNRAADFVHRNRLVPRRIGRALDLRGIGRVCDDADVGAVGAAHGAPLARQLHREPTAQRHCRARRLDAASTTGGCSTI